MSDAPLATVSIVDYGLGNLFSIQSACAAVGLAPTIASSAREMLAADGIILPGVGAFATAMQNLRRLGLIDQIRHAAETGKPILGICLGMQLLMEQSTEFGVHEGLGLIAGSVIRFDRPRGAGGSLKVPQVGWNRLLRPSQAKSDPWFDSPLDGLPDGVFMYFVHSYHCQPAEPATVLATADYGGIEFCAALKWGQITAFQCHPERSGPAGMHVYRRFAAQLMNARSGNGAMAA